jgi:hypothetical protein
MERDEPLGSQYRGSDIGHSIETEVSSALIVRTGILFRSSNTQHIKVLEET